MTARERLIATRAREIEADLVERLQVGEELDGVDRLILVARGVGLRAVRTPGEPVRLAPAEVALLAEGAAAALLAWAECDVNSESERAAELAREFASKPAILH